MSKVITFSRFFPPHHVHHGQPTDFVEKFWSGLLKIDRELYADYLHPDGVPYEEYPPKFHTIRAGLRFKAGDKFSPRIWQNVPYKSKQLQFAPDMVVKKTWGFEMKCGAAKGALVQECFINGKRANASQIAKNDGLELVDFLSWFNRPFTGQVISWTEHIEY